MYFIASSLSEWSRIRRTGTSEIDSSTTSEILHTDVAAPGRKGRARHRRRPGIGAAIAHRFAQEGANAAPHGRRRDRGHAGGGGHRKRRRRPRPRRHQRDRVGGRRSLGPREPRPRRRAREQRRRLSRGEARRDHARRLPPRAGGQPGRRIPRHAHGRPADGRARQRLDHQRLLRRGPHGHAAT